MASSTVPDRQTLEEIAQYHSDAVGALTFFLKSLLQANDPRFLGFTPSEFKELLSRRIDETDLRSSLSILAFLEATLRIDYELRVSRKRKDPLSKNFRTIDRRRKKYVRLDEDLLDTWNQHYPSLKSLVGEFRTALHFRHWLAHGRYWRRPTHRKFDYPTLSILAEEMLTQFPLLRD